MQFKDLVAEAIKIKGKYEKLNSKNINKQWKAEQYLQGFVGDVGDLSKLIMAKNGYRDIEGIDEKIEHELSDCLWSILVIADELGVDLEKGFLNTTKELEEKLSNL